MENSPLGRLPPELRVMIYEYALREDYASVFIFPVTLPSRNEIIPGVTIRSEDYKAGPLAGLPSTCRQIRKESRPVYFAINEFSARSDHDFGHEFARGMTDAIGADMMKHITQLRVVWPFYLVSVSTEYQWAMEVPGKDNLWSKLHEFKRVLRPGSRLMFQTFIEVDDDDYSEVWLSMSDEEAAISDLRQLLRWAVRKGHIERHVVEDNKIVVEIENLLQKVRGRINGDVIEDEAAGGVENTSEDQERPDNKEGAADECSRKPDQELKVQRVVVRREQCVHCVGIDDAASCPWQDHMAPRYVSGKS